MPKSFQKIILLVLIFATTMRSSEQIEAWEKPGCHKIGHTRKVSIPDCVEFRMTTNACRGFCESWAVPSSTEAWYFNRGQSITSVGQCCNIVDTEDIIVQVMCLDGIREITFKSAVTCSCHHCKKQ